MLLDRRLPHHRLPHQRRHLEALIDGHWLVVPSEKILQRADNPTGHAVVCWTPTLGIMCFVRAAEI